MVVGRRDGRRRRGRRRARAPWRGLRPGGRRGRASRRGVVPIVVAGERHELVVSPMAGAEPDLAPEQRGDRHAEREHEGQCPATARNARSSSAAPWSSTTRAGACRALRRVRAQRELAARGGASSAAIARPRPLPGDGGARRAAAMEALEHRILLALVRPGPWSRTSMSPSRAASCTARRARSGSRSRPARRGCGRASSARGTVGGRRAAGAATSTSPRPRRPAAPSGPRRGARHRPVVGPAPAPSAARLRTSRSSTIAGQPVDLAASPRRARARRHRGRSSRVPPRGAAARRSAGCAAGARRRRRTAAGAASSPASRSVIALNERASDCCSTLPSTGARGSRSPPAIAACDRLQAPQRPRDPARDQRPGDDARSPARRAPASAEPPSAATARGHRGDRLRDPHRADHAARAQRSAPRWPAARSPQRRAEAPILDAAPAQRGGDLGPLAWRRRRRPARPLSAGTRPRASTTMTRPRDVRRPPHERGELRGAARPRRAGRRRSRRPRRPGRAPAGAPRRRRGRGRSASSGTASETTASRSDVGGAPAERRPRSVTPASARRRAGAAEADAADRVDGAARPGPRRACGAAFRRGRRASWSTRTSSRPTRRR